MASPLRVEHDFAKPPDRVFAYMAEHEHLAPLLGAKITRLSDGGDGARNGVGSSRELRIGPLPPFVETTTEVVPSEKIVYRITKGSPLKDHVGTMTFAPTAAGGTHFTWDVHLDSAIPGLAPVVRLGLKRSITKNLPDADRRA